MISRVHLSTVVWIAACLWAVLLIAQGVTVSLDFFRPVQIVLAALVLLLAIFDRWAWRWHVLHPWFVPVPDLRGMWKAELTSTWVDPETRGPVAPIEAYLVIRQTFSSIKLRLITRESESQSLAAAIVNEGPDRHTIAAIYLNTPRLLRREVSPIHHGALLLRAWGSPPDALSGEYWTERDTKGEMSFTERVEELPQNFQGAAAGTCATGGAPPSG